MQRLGAVLARDGLRRYGRVVAIARASSIDINTGKFSTFLLNKWHKANNSLIFLANYRIDREQHCTLMHVDAE